MQRIRKTGRGFACETRSLSRQWQCRRRAAVYSAGIECCRDVIIKAQDAEVMKFSKEHSLNTVRLSIYTRFSATKRTTRSISRNIRTFIDPVVQAAKKERLYVILDGHEYLQRGDR